MPDSQSAFYLLNAFCLSLYDYAEVQDLFTAYSRDCSMQIEITASKHSLPYNSKSVMGERTAPHFTGDSSPLTNRLVT